MSRDPGSTRVTNGSEIKKELSCVKCLSVWLLVSTSWWKSYHFVPYLHVFKISHVHMLCADIIFMWKCNLHLCLKLIVLQLLCSQLTFSFQYVSLFQPSQQCMCMWSNRYIFICSVVVEDCEGVLRVTSPELFMKWYSFIYSFQISQICHLHTLLTNFLRETSSLQWNSEGELF